MGGEKWLPPPPSPPGPEIQISGKAGTDKQTGAHEHFNVAQEIWGCEGSVIGMANV